jgi:adenosine deaminase
MPGLVAALPKAHLHLHFTGSMRHGTLLDLAAQHRLS